MTGLYFKEHKDFGMPRGMWKEILFEFYGFIDGKRYWVDVSVDRNYDPIHIWEHAFSYFKRVERNEVCDCYRKVDTAQKDVNGGMFMFKFEHMCKECKEAFSDENNVL